MKKSFRFLDLSGVGNSGKSAMIDVLREFESLHVASSNFEFDLFRVPGGILDLRTAIVDYWSPIRSNAALKKFRKVVQSMGINPSNTDLLGLINSSSQRYDRYFNAQFTRVFNNFSDKLVLGSYESYWPYDGLSDAPFMRFIKKIGARLGSANANYNLVSLVNSNKFDELINDAMLQLYSEIVGGEKKWVTFNNSFEPYTPEPFFKMLPTAKQIVVLRDPRDIYVSGKNPKTSTQENKLLLTDYHSQANYSFLASDDLSVFVKRYELYRSKVLAKPNERVLQINFEDLCLNYNNVVEKIYSFLDLTAKDHNRIGEYFKPELSKKNVGLWKAYTHKSEIEYIESNLGQYLYSL